MFFGSSDAGELDHRGQDAGLAVADGLSVRLFGLTSLEHPGAAGADRAWPRSALLYAAVRRVGSAPAAGLLAGAVLALTPVAVLMFRFNNPDALLVLLLVARRVRDGARGRDRPAPGGSCWPAPWSGSAS